MSFLPPFSLGDAGRPGELQGVDPGAQPAPTLALPRV